MMCRFAPYRSIEKRGQNEYKRAINLGVKFGINLTQKREAECLPFCLKPIFKAWTYKPAKASLNKLLGCMASATLS